MDRRSEVESVCQRLELIRPAGSHAQDIMASRTLYELEAEPKVKLPLVGSEVMAGCFKGRLLGPSWSSRSRGVLDVIRSPRRCRSGGLESDRASRKGNKNLL